MTTNRKTRRPTTPNQWHGLRVCLRNDPTKTGVVKWTRWDKYKRHAVRCGVKWDDAAEGASLAFHNGGFLAPISAPAPKPVSKVTMIHPDEIPVKREGLYAGLPADIAGELEAADREAARRLGEAEVCPCEQCDGEGLKPCQFDDAGRDHGYYGAEIGQDGSVPW